MVLGASDHYRGWAREEVEFLFPFEKFFLNGLTCGPSICRPNVMLSSINTCHVGGSGLHLPKNMLTLLNRAINSLRRERAPKVIVM
jgi:hypothetical protein